MVSFVPLSHWGTDLLVFLSAVARSYMSYKYAKMVNVNRDKRAIKEEAVTLENQSAFSKRTHNESIVSSANYL